MRSNLIPAVQLFFPGLEIASDGACFGFKEAVLNSLGDSESLKRRLDVIEYGYSDESGRKITSGDLEQLLNDLEKKSAHKVEKKETAKDLSKTAKEIAEQRTKTFSILEKEAQDQISELRKKHPIKDSTITPEEEKFLANLVTAETKEDKRDTRLFTQITPEELVKQIRLAREINNKLIELYGYNSKAYKEFHAAHHYIYLLNEMETFLINIGLKQNPALFPQLFDEPISQLVNPVSSWISPVALDDKGVESENQRVIISDFSCRYSISSLQNSFDLLDTQLQTYAKKRSDERKESITQLPILITATSNRHAITLSFPWEMFDISDPVSTVRSIQPTKIGQEIFAALIDVDFILFLQGIRFIYFVGYNKISKKLILMDVNENTSKSGEINTDKLMCELIKSNEIITRDNATFNIAFQIYVVKEMKSEIYGVIKPWIENQNVTSEMVVPLNSIDDIPLLHFHCKLSANTERLHEIIRVGADINQLDVRQLTPLCIACLFKKEDMVSHLLKYSSVIELNKGKLLPMFVAVALGFINIIHLLKQAGAIIIPRMIMVSEVGKHPTVTNLLVAWGVNFDEALEILKTEKLHLESERLQKDRFKYYVCSITHEPEDKKMFTAFAHLIETPSQLADFFKGSTWFYINPREIEFKGIAAEIPMFDKYLTTKSDWQSFWDEFKSSQNLSSEAIFKMQQKILFIFRLQIIKSTTWSRSNPELLEKNQQLLNLRLAAFTPQLICKWLEYQFKHLPFLFQLNEVEKRELLRFKTPANESDLLIFDLLLKGLSYKCMQDEDEKKPLPHQLFSGSAAVSSSDKKEDFETGLARIKQAFNKIINTVADEKKEEAHLSSDESHAKEKLELLMEKVETILSNQSQSLKDFYSFAVVGLCTFSQALIDAERELEFFIAPASGKDLTGLINEFKQKPRPGQS